MGSVVVLVVHQHAVEVKEDEVALGANSVVLLGWQWSTWAPSVIIRLIMFLLLL